MYVHTTDSIKHYLKEQGIIILHDDPEQARLVEALMRSGNQSGFTLTAAQIASQKPQIVAQEQKTLNEKPQGTQAQQAQTEEDPKLMRKQQFL